MSERASECEKRLGGAAGPREERTSFQEGSRGTLLRNNWVTAAWTHAASSDARCSPI